VSWEPGRVVAWAGGPGAPAGTAHEVRVLLSAAGAPDSGWTEHGAVPLSGGNHADALAIPVGHVLGWLVAAAAGHAGEEVGSSCRWLGRVAIWAVECTAHGAVVPRLRRRTRSQQRSTDRAGSFSVRWLPALVDTQRLARTAERMPGSVRALDRKVDAVSLITDRYPRSPARRRPSGRGARRGSP
jgi:hypothetical protein